jgi:CDAN1-interacting nuclease 1
MLEFGWGLSHREVSRVMADPSALRSGPQGTAPDRLRADVQRAMEVDPLFAPFHDRMRALTGAEYERRLEAGLCALGLSGAFVTERQLREDGLARTPDVRLTVPLCVRVPDRVRGSGRADGGVRWRVVCWIDSKAMFGDVRTRRQHSAQLQAYVNRFGPGLVVYWFGFVDTTTTTAARVDSQANGIAAADQHKPNGPVTGKENRPPTAPLHEPVRALPMGAAASTAAVADECIESDSIVVMDRLPTSDEILTIEQTIAAEEAMANGTATVAEPEPVTPTERPADRASSGATSPKAVVNLT